MAQMVKNLPAIQICRRHKFDPWVRNIPWKGKWQPTPVPNYQQSESFHTFGRLWFQNVRGGRDLRNHLVQFPHFTEEAPEIVVVFF